MADISERDGETLSDEQVATWRSDAEYEKARLANAGLLLTAAPFTRLIALCDTVTALRAERDRLAAYDEELRRSVIRQDDELAALRAEVAGLRADAANDLDSLGALTWARDEAERAEERAVEDRKSGSGEPWTTYARVFRDMLASRAARAVAGHQGDTTGE